jgi:hypothetical protein
MAIIRITTGENSLPRAGMGEVVTSNRLLGGQPERPRYNPARGFELCCSAVQLGRFVPENIHRPIELLNLQWLLQNRDRTNLKNPIEDLAIRIICDHDNVEIRIAESAAGRR